MRVTVKASYCTADAQGPHPNAAALRNTVDIPAQAYISLQPPRLHTALQMSAVPLSAAVIHESLAH